MSGSESFQDAKPCCLDGEKRSQRDAEEEIELIAWGIQCRLGELLKLDEVKCRVVSDQ
jgi:hypothetical protein